MENEKCFCHFNGYKVKDSDARSSIEKLNKDIATSNININLNKENIEIIKDDLKNLGVEVSLSKDSIETNKLNISSLQTSMTGIKADNDSNKARVEAVEETLNNIGEVGESVAEINAKINTNTENIETIMNTKDVYSYEETLTNKVWVDSDGVARPVYRKIFTGTKTGTANVDVPIYTHNMLKAKIVHAEMHTNNGLEIKPMPYSEVHSGSTNYVYIAIMVTSDGYPGDIRVMSESQYYRGYFEVTVEYTKKS